jgi:exopolysaccharide biosynthesis polyprenyl glycosylphosphotransferase
VAQPTTRAPIDVVRDVPVVVAGFDTAPVGSVSAVTSRAVAAGRARYRYEPLLLCATDAVVAFLVLAAVIGLERSTFALAAIVPAALALAGLDGYRPTLSVLDELPRLVAAQLAAFGAVVLVATAMGEARPRDLAAPTVIAVVGVIVIRLFTYAVVRRLRRSGVFSRPAVIVGRGAAARDVARILIEHGHAGLRPVGFVGDERTITSPDDGVPVLGRSHELPQILADDDVHHVVLAASGTVNAELLTTLRRCDASGIEVYTAAGEHQLGASLSPAWAVGDQHLTVVHRSVSRRLSWRCKRGLDIVVALALLLVSLPLFIASAAAVWIDCRRPIIFRQTRIGEDGREIEVWKFTTLRPVDASEDTTRWSIVDDPRISPVGRFLRSSSLDELPQLINVICGRMSIVGPRPERPFFVAQFSSSVPGYLDRHRVPAGITGLAQVNGLRGDTSIARRARYDNAYIDSWSLWSDVKIIIRTIVSVCLKRGG